VDNGVLADLGQDLIVSASVKEEIGTEGQAAQWGFELEGNSDGRGRMLFAQDSDSVVGKTSLRCTPNPYPGLYATAIFPSGRDADWNFSGKTRIRFWIKATNPNLPGFQNSGPVLWLYGKDGTVKIEPSKGRNLFGDLPFSEARWTWIPWRCHRRVMSDGRARHRQSTGATSPASVSFDSWRQTVPVWPDGLAWFGPYIFYPHVHLIFAGLCWFWSYCHLFRGCLPHNPGLIDFNSAYWRVCVGPATFDVDATLLIDQRWPTIRRPTAGTSTRARGIVLLVSESI
jgi:hypothetical protein